MMLLNCAPPHPKRTDRYANDRRTQEAQNTFPGAENIRYLVTTAQP